MFSGLLAKATAALGIIVAFLLALLKLKNSKIEKQQDELDAYNKRDDIIEDMEFAKNQAEAKENEALEDTSDTNWRDNI